MIKESILFVASTGVLIYFITPTEKAPEADTQESEQVVRKAAPPVDDGWGDEDETEDDDESFVFGEPIGSLDDDYGEPSAEEEDSSDRLEQTDTKAASSASVAKSRQRISANSPGPNEKGGVNNPVILEARTPSTIIDD